MHFKTLCILLLIKTLKVDGKGHRSFPRKVQGVGEVTPVIATGNENINLPNGFSPQPSPMNSMLYPFATEQPTSILTDSTSGWRPIVRRGTTKIPVLQDRFATESKELHQDIGTVQVQITRRPSYYKRPVLQQAEFMVPGKSTNIARSRATSRNGVWRQIGGFVEGTNYKRPIEISSRQQTKHSNRASNEKHGRRRIANFTDKTKDDAPTPQTNDLEKFAKTNNTDDAALLSIAKQINESVELHRFPKYSSKERFPNEDNDNDTTKSTIDTSDPTSRDSLDSHESDKPHARNISNKFYNFFDDNSSDPRRTNGETNFDDIFTPTSSFNITKVGVPFEDQNSAEELSICVPLSVRERSLLNENEIVDVERVYCFPLPTADKNKTNENGTVSLDADDDFGALNYENPTTSNSVPIKAALTVISIAFFLM